MTISWGVIIAIIYVVAHIVAAVAKESAKRKEEQRRREEAARRRGAPVAATSQADSPVNVDPMLSTARSSPSPRSLPQRTGVPKDDLGARRREQIEMLRNRRQVRQGRLPGGARTPETSRTSANPSSVAGEELRRREIEEAKVRHAKQVRKQQREAEAAGQRDRQKRELAFQETVRQDPAPVQSAPRVSQTSAVRSSTSTVAVMNERHGGQDAFRSRLKDVTSLRDGLIIRELLDKPLSLR